MNTCTFMIPGEPRGKERPRFARRGGHVSTYTPPKTEAYEQLVQLSFSQQCRPFFCAQGLPLSVYINAYYGIPKNISKKTRMQMLSGEIKPTKKPDLDNVAKAVCDALNKLAYHDDSQINRMHLEKGFSETPHIDVILCYQEENHA